MRLLITGANGFVGRHLVREFQKNHDLFCLVRSDHDLLKSKKINYIKTDLKNPLDLIELPKIDAIVHLSQSPSKDPKDLFEINERATVDLLDFAAKSAVKTFIFASTGSVYGSGSEAFNESDPVNPTDGYSISKRNAEKWGFVYSDRLNFVSLRLFGPYGEGQTGRLVPNIVDKVRKGVAIELKKNFAPKISFIYIKDLLEVLEKCLYLNQSEIFNVGGEKSISIKEIAQIAGKHLKKKPNFEISEEKGGDLVGDIAKVKKLLKWKPKVSFEDGLRRLINSQEEE